MNDDLTEFPPEIIERLGCYVYIYIDPTGDEPFYVGRGQGNRAFHHLFETDETAKVARIAAIRARGQTPRIELLRYGLNEEQAAVVEAVAIDLLGLGRLTNRVRGHHRGTFGRITARDLVELGRARPVEVIHPAILITINQLYRSDMSPAELYEATRGVWKLAPWRASRAQLALAVVFGVVKAVYRPIRWLPAGTLPYETRYAADFAGSGRYEFDGEAAEPALRERYVGGYVGRGGQNPICYIGL